MKDVYIITDISHYENIVAVTFSEEKAIELMKEYTKMMFGLYDEMINYHNEGISFIDKEEFGEDMFKHDIIGFEITRPLVETLKGTPISVFLGM